MIYLRSYLDYTIESEKSPEHIYLILTSVTRHRKDKWKSIRPEFIGEVYPTYFKFVRNTFYYNSFSPVITGQIIAIDYKTIIQIKMRLHSFTRIFEIIWFGFILLFFVIGIFNFFITDFQEWSLITHSILMIAGGLLITKGVFYMQVKKDHEKLAELLET